MLALINKRWAKVLSGPSHAWDTANLWVRAAPERPTDPGAAITWFIRRPGYVAVVATPSSKVVNGAASKHQ